MNIGDRIRKRRVELNMSQSELARKVGYKTRSSINKIELGERDVPRAQIIAIAEALRTTPSYLAGWETDGEFAELTAIQEDIVEKVFELTPENQQTLLGIIDTLLQAQTRKESKDD